MCYPVIIPNCPVNEDQWLMNYLVMNKNRVERAKSALDAYFSLRWTLPEAYSLRDMTTERMVKAFDNTCVMQPLTIPRLRDVFLAFDPRSPNLI